MRKKGKKEQIVIEEAKNKKSSLLSFFLYSKLAYQGSKLKKSSGHLLATTRKIIVGRCKFGGKLALFMRFGTFFMMKAKQDKMKCLF